MIGFVQGQTAWHWTGNYRRKSGRVDHEQARIMLATAFSDLPSVDLSRQLYVGDQHVGGLPHPPCHRLFPAARLDHVVIFLSQRFNCKFADKRVVLDNEYAHGNVSTSEI